MFDLIPTYNYTLVFNYTILVLVLIAFWQCNSGVILNKKTVAFNAMWGVMLSVVLIFYMGLRPISDIFGDTVNYATGFYEMQNSKEPFMWQWESDWLFYNIMQVFAKYSNIHSFFLLCSGIYVGCLWLAMKRIFDNYYYIPLLVIFSMFFFWSYGVNGIRNGLSGSIIILAMTYVNNIPAMIFLALIALGMHKSTLLMIGACGIAWFIKNSKLYLFGWILCVLLSYFAGSTIQEYFLTFDFLGEDTRFSGYLTGENMIGEIVQMSMTFRWDFLLYSSIAVVVGAYFIFILHFNDEYYHWWYNSYLTMNAFWILIIRAAYSNRFAQISWFIMPVLLIYPFLKKRFWLNHERYLGLAILLFYLFTFYYNIIRGQ